MLNKTQVLNESALVREAITVHMGQRPHDLIHVPSYPDTIVYKARLDHTCVVFKATDPSGSDPSAIGAEAWACTQARTVGVPVPQMFAVDTTHALFPASFFIMDHAQGQSQRVLHLPLEQQRPFLRQVGRYLRLLHTIKLDGYGWLDEHHYLHTQHVRGHAITWRQALLPPIASSLAYLERHANVTTDITDRVRHIISTSDEQLNGTVESCLLHGDIGDVHMWFDMDRQMVTAIIDFGERSAGDPIWDIAAYDDWHGISYLLEGYEPDNRTQATFEPKYWLYNVLRAVPWARKWHARGAIHTVEVFKKIVQVASERLS